MNNTFNKWYHIIIYNIQRRVVRYFLRFFLPINPKKIVFENFCGRGFGDSPMYIAKEIIRQGLDYDLVWLTNNDKEDMPCEIRKVRYRSFRALLEIYTAKVWVGNQVIGINEHKRKGQYYIQTWHGGGVPMKYVQRGGADTISDHEIKLDERNSMQIDYIISDNKLITADYRQNFWLSDNCKILECGMPCKDGLFCSQDEVLRCKEKIIGDKNVRIVLYAPTFRDDNSTKGYECNLEAVRRKLEEKTSQKWVVIVRMHPNAVKFANYFEFGENIINASEASNSNDLTIASDVLITDYSSISSDFLYLDKPVFILALDLEHYVTKCRKLQQYYYSLPYPFCTSNQELLNVIEGFDYGSYLQKITEYKKNILKPFCHGHSSEYMVKIIKEIIEEK